jgi:hypothetical protein
MSTRTRFLVILIVTAAAVSAMTVYTILRLRYWDERGSAGLSYIQVTPSAKKQPVFFGLKPGDVVVTYPGGAAESSGVKARDHLLAIGGLPITDLEALAKLDARVRTGDTVVYRIQRGKETREIPVRFASLVRTPLFIASTVIAFLVAAAFIAIGLLVFTRQQKDERVSVFYAGVMVGALSLLSSPAVMLEAAAVRGFQTSGLENVVALGAMMTTTFMLLPLILHLSLVFPRRRPILGSSPRVLRWIYGAPLTAVLVVFFAIGVTKLSTVGEPALKRYIQPANIAFATFTLAGLLIALRIARKGRAEGVWRAFWNRPIQTLIVVFSILFGIARVAGALKIGWLAVLSSVLAATLPFLALAAYPILACVSLYRSYREANVEERRQVKWPLWAIFTVIALKVVVTVGVQIGSFILLATGQELNTYMRVASAIGMIPTLLYLLIPISFAVAIRKYRLMNIDLIIRKTVVYAMLSGLIIVVYLALVGGLGTVLVKVAGVRSQTMVITSTLVVAALFVPLRNKLQTLVDRNLFRHKYEYPDALLSITSDARNAADAGALLQSASEKLQQALQNRSVVVFVERQEELVATAKVGVADTLLGRLRLPHSIVEHLDGPFDPRKRTLPEEAATALAKIESALVLPLGRRGLISVAPKLSGGELDGDDIEFLRSVAGEVAMALERMRMRVEEADFAQARAIQQTLIPREMPRVQGLDVSGMWHPARTMGGDYYDLIELSPTQLAICIGDVAGKGMPAALLMSGLQAAVRASASDSPRDLCERVRRVVVSSLSGGRFVTFFYATLDTAAMRLRWCNAGHNAPILVRADGKVVRLSEGGPAFSRLFRHTPYEERELALQPGDRIVLFTDGASEAADANGDLLGEGRIEEIVAANRTLAARALQQAIADAATSFSRGELEDDITLVVVAL